VLKTIVIAGVLAGFSVTMCGCTSNGTLNSTATADMQNALAVACPIVGVVQASTLPLSGAQKAALSTLTLACPPNPPPTSALIMAEDIISAYTILQPLLQK